MDVRSFVSNTVKEVEFSGVILVKDEKNVIFEKVHSYSNRSEEILNTINTRFGIASGCKLFTAIAISQLVDKGILSIHNRLNDCLDINFPHFDKSITIHQLLTHSSGIPDYFNEEVMNDYEDLWKDKPMYLIKNLKEFLPMFQNENMMFAPGERFHYNNAGFIVLGLIIEQQTGLKFSEYIESNIFQICDMNDSGYFSLDQLPKNTALGYIDNEEEGTWRTNTYSVPIKGGADGGAFITAPDMMKLWEGLFSYKLLSEESTNLLLTPHIYEKDDEYYGYGIWISKRNNRIFKYHVMGYDPGVSFHSSYYPDSGIKIVVPSNKNYGPYKITRVIEDKLFQK
ncbi:serine hydrolase domain-containing protein [Chengkuizengella sediminis]|uniref:serine hydrolase domain-containing protein n=1 Tax=Chengkuizengella sediminis TaxID=1885917 RepID=UPI0013899CAC|nr:serine hydrolase [Chengkuizengella sediminis]NDI34157.1 serine hydrolase [Chengkuizengella sediminis]